MVFKCWANNATLLMIFCLLFSQLNGGLAISFLSFSLCQSDKIDTDWVTISQFVLTKYKIGICCIIDISPFTKFGFLFKVLLPCYSIQYLLTAKLNRDK